MNIVCVTSKHNVGCSFVDWSIHFLSGAVDYFSVNDLKLIPLSLNPVNSRNSHGHKKNHPKGVESTSKYITEFLKQPDGLYTMYPTQLDIDNTCNRLGIDCNGIDNHTQFKIIQDYQYNDYCKMIDHCIDHNVQVVYVHNNYQAVGYFWNIRSLDRHLTKSMPYKNIKEAETDFQTNFFNNSINTWKSLKLENCWDVRERMALDTRPYNTSSFKEVGITKNHLWVDCQDLWHNTEVTLIELLKFINVKLVQQRWAEWLPIMQKWQLIQRKNLKFYYTIDHIVNSIVNNWYYPLEPMTLAQEAIIQHCLIYKHNLNLKTWLLSQFPANTQELHKLLEPNPHIVPAIYNTI